MASKEDHPAFVELLPDRPNLEMQHKRAKELVRAAWAGDATAMARIRALHPQPPTTDAIRLADAQLAVTMWTLCCESTSPGNGTASRKWEGVFFVVAPDGLC